VKDYGPGAALGIAFIVAVLYAEGGVFRTVASLILLAVLITPANGMPSILQGLLTYLGELLRGEKVV